ncbi:hypothetical protein [Planococcus sp. YIM B11945]|uniref:hypothetical protein n=1 Tax=Planococcus sp. YIM B11945 TaxID=3435410 RepID=UPI003D7CCDEB
MTFKMTIVNTRHDSHGKQEDRVVVENAQPVSGGAELLKLIQAALQTKVDKSITIEPFALDGESLADFALNRYKPIHAKTFKSPEASPKVSITVDAEQLRKDGKPSIPAEKVKEAIEIAEGLPKTVELLGAKDNGFTVAEKLGLVIDNPPAEIIKKKNEQEIVQVLIRCLECGYNGTHTTFRQNKFIKCKSCGEKLFLDRAADEWGEEDFDGNVYVAQDRYKTVRERWEEKNLAKEESE